MSSLETKTYLKETCPISTSYFVLQEHIVKQTSPWYASIKPSIKLPSFITLHKAYRNKQMMSNQAVENPSNALCAC